METLLQRHVIGFPIGSTALQVEQSVQRLLPDLAGQYNISSSDTKYPALKQCKYSPPNLCLNKWMNEHERGFWIENSFILQVVKIQCLAGWTSLVKEQTALRMESESMVSSLFNIIRSLLRFSNALIWCSQENKKLGWQIDVLWFTYYNPKWDVW